MKFSVLSLCVNLSLSKFLYAHFIFHFIFIYLSGCLSESLTAVEIIKSHMALKHGLKNYAVAREVLNNWFQT